MDELLPKGTGTDWSLFNYQANKHLLFLAWFHTSLLENIESLVLSMFFPFLWSYFKSLAAPLTYPFFNLKLKIQYNDLNIRTIKFGWKPTYISLIFLGYNHFFYFKRKGFLNT